MKKKETEFLTEEEAQAILRVPDRRALQGKRDYAILLTFLVTVFCDSSTLPKALIWWLLMTTTLLTRVLHTFAWLVRLWLSKEQWRHVKAGRSGGDVRSDCKVIFEPRTAGGIALELQSRVAPYYGDSIRTQATGLLDRAVKTDGQPGKPKGRSPITFSEAQRAASTFRNSQAITLAHSLSDWCQIRESGQLKPIRW